MDAWWVHSGVQYGIAGEDHGLVVAREPRPPEHCSWPRSPALTPTAAGMEDGERPWLKPHVHTPAARDPKPGDTRKRPLIYIYELPPIYNTLLLQVGSVPPPDQPHLTAAACSRNSEGRGSSSGGRRSGSGGSSSSSRATLAGVPLAAVCQLQCLCSPLAVVPVVCSTARTRCSACTASSLKRMEQYCSLVAGGTKPRQVQQGGTPGRGGSLTSHLLPMCPNFPVLPLPCAGLHEMLLQSEHRTLDPEEADYFYIPVGCCCFCCCCDGGAPLVQATARPCCEPCSGQACIPGQNHLVCRYPCAACRLTAAASYGPFCVSVRARPCCSAGQQICMPWHAVTDGWPRRGGPALVCAARFIPGPRPTALQSSQTFLSSMVAQQLAASTARPTCEDE